MAVMINRFSKKLRLSFQNEQKRLRGLLGAGPKIEHIGSTAVGIGGKNIIDILIGVKTQSEMKKTKDILTKNGYFVGKDNHSNRIFLASSEEETNEGDFHIHLCLEDSEEFQNFIMLRDYLLANPTRAKEYFDKKKAFAKQANYDREEYKKLKSAYVSELLELAKTKNGDSGGS